MNMNSSSQQQAQQQQNVPGGQIPEKAVYLESSYIYGEPEQSQFDQAVLQMLQRIMPSSRTAIFDDHVEYHQPDGGKLVDRGDKLSVHGGRWSTTETEAALLVDAAAAKGWDVGVLREDTDPEFAEYVKAFGRARGLRVEYVQDLVAEQAVEQAAPAQEASQSGFVPLAAAPTTQQYQQKKMEIEP
ncbi:hypothetical protein C9940_00610 [Pseudidiomarina aestuarii]|uniref:Large polyvalent protein-associated domain-containing protein n=1 Tax=Pseudidiomarina aestuarii TaxID=624146 RepID=A0A2T4CZ62_9GAMM|nr:hypothetical protein C9940_00610 [Pseudidiomarina aestuarii]